MDSVGKEERLERNASHGQCIETGHEPNCRGQVPGRRQSKIIHWEGKRQTIQQDHDLGWRDGEMGKGKGSMVKVKKWYGAHSTRAGNTFHISTSV